MYSMPAVGNANAVLDKATPSSDPTGMQVWNAILAISAAVMSMLLAWIGLRQAAQEAKSARLKPNA